MTRSSTTALLVSLLFAAVCSLLSCKGQNGRSAHAGGDTLQLRHAQHLTIVRHAGYTTVDLADPWNEGKTLHTYVLVPRTAPDGSDNPLPTDLPKGTVVRTPLQHSVIATSAHCRLLQDFGRLTCIAGICDLPYMHLPAVQQRCREGRIADCGSSMSPALETVLDLQPDAIFLSPFQNSGGYGRLEKLDIPIIETADYMETSPLGRAEWMRYYGILFGAEHVADSLFAAVETEYCRLKELALRSAHRPNVLMDKQMSSVWYVPGGHSTVGRLIADANLRYPWAADTHSGSLALAFESVFEQAADADLWLLRYNAPSPLTLRSLASEHQGYSRLPVWQKGNVYGCNSYGNTFHEDTPFRPDLLLRDFITIGHPDLQLGAPHYFVRIE